MSGLYIIMFVIGLIAGMFVMAFICAHYLEELYRHEEELDDTIEQMNSEITVKQNVINANNETISRLRSELKLLKRKNNEYQRKFNK